MTTKENLRYQLEWDIQLGCFPEDWLVQSIRVILTESLLHLNPGGLAKKVDAG